MLYNTTQLFFRCYSSKKWKNIRDTYATKLRENKGKSGQGRKSKSAYMYTNQLNFLSDVLQPRPTDTSMNDVADLLPNDRNKAVSETFHDETSPVHASKKRKGNLVEKNF